jgi:hypothetical protein
MDITALTFDERDEFSRKPIAEKAIALLQSDIDVSPLVIDGGWGTGKTEFCHKLINLMRVNETHHLIYIDAFKADHADEPLMTVLAEVIKVLPDDDSKQSFMKKALPAVRYGFKASAKAVVSHVLKQDFADVADDFDKAIQKTADKAIDATVESVLKDHVKAEQNLKSLQTALAEIAAEKPIVLFVDELDRCRPNFAVDMLEIIKHTFDVDGVSFVLITNTQQLKASVNHCYGHSVDAQRYLDKFVKFSISLSQQIWDSASRHNEVSIKHFENLVGKSSIINSLNIQSHNDHCHSLISHIIKVNSISLREVESLIRHIEIYQILTNDKGLHNNVVFGIRIMRLLGILFFCFKPELAKLYISKTADAKEVGIFLNCRSIVSLDKDSPRPEVYEIATTLIGRDCRYNAELFKTTDPINTEHWNKLMDSFFAGNLYSFGEEATSESFIEAIRVFSLNS